MKTILLLMAAGLCFGQDPVAQPKFYKFDFVVKELDGGKVVSAKSYSSMGRPNTRPQDNSLMIRSGDRVPFTNNKGEATMLDVGTNIDCRVLSENAGQMTLYVSLDLSSADAQRPPVISQTKWNSNVEIPLKKATVVFSSESATKKVTTQLEITVTPLQ